MNNFFYDSTSANNDLFSDTERNQNLINLGFYKIEQSPDNICSPEYPLVKFDASGKAYFYKKTAISVSDEDYAKLLCCFSKKPIKNHSITATILYSIAFIIYGAGFPIGLALSVTQNGHPTATMIIYWIVSFLLGTLYLGLSEITKLLFKLTNNK